MSSRSKNFFIVVGVIILAIIVGAVIYVRVQKITQPPVVTGPTPEQQQAYLKAVKAMEDSGKIKSPTLAEQKAFIKAVEKQQATPVATGPTDVQKQAFISAFNKTK